MPDQVEAGGPLPIYPYYNYLIAPREETRAIREEEQTAQRVEAESQYDLNTRPQSVQADQEASRSPQQVEPSDEGQREENRQDKEEERSRHVDRYA
ncbi:MAG: hypothetical protein V2A56_09150 [bacterium]